MIETMEKAETMATAGRNGGAGQDCAREIVFHTHESYGDCEYCGGLTYRKLTVRHDGEEIGVFHTSDHFGPSEFDRVEIEGAVRGALAIAKDEYEAFVAEREAREDEVRRLYESDDQDRWEEASKLEAEIEDLFDHFLSGKGYVVTREYSYEEDDSGDYFDDDFDD